MHGTEETNIFSYKRLQLLDQIQKLYDCAPNMMASDRDIFDYPFEEREKHSNASLQLFLSATRPIVKISSERAAELGANTRPITSYYRRYIPPEMFEIIHPQRWKSFQRRDSDASDTEPPD